MTMVYVHHVPQHDAADRLDRAFGIATRAWRDSNSPLDPVSPSPPR
jgi:hypothetical protein